MPSTTKNNVYIQPSIEIFQSHVVVKSWAIDAHVLRAARLACVMPIAFDSGSQNTENP